MRCKFNTIACLLTALCLMFILPLPARATDCLNVSDVPLETRFHAAAANIMFVLDDSGSMDWEFMTEENDGKFQDNAYVFDDPGDNVFTSWSGSGYTFSRGTERMKWKSQYSGYNNIYYDPSVDYEPWPTIAGMEAPADPDTPRSHPMHATPTFNLSGEYDSMVTGSTIIVDNEDDNFSKTPDFRPGGGFRSGFEEGGGGWDDNWNDNGTTNWRRSRSQKHSGSYSARARNRREGYFTSDDLDASGADSITVDFWFRKDDTESYDFTLYYYNGSSYINVAELDGLGGDDQWLHYTDTITDSQYFVSDFRIRFDATLGYRENVWVDDVIITVQAEVAGPFWDWSTEGGYNGHYFWTAADGGYTATWTPNIPVTTEYEVSAMWHADTNRSTNVVYTINHAGGSSTTTPQNQTENGDQWVLLGTYTFNQGTGGNVTISFTQTSTSGNVCADAMKFETPEAGTVVIKNAHYYVWSDSGNRPYLVILDDDSDNGGANPEIKYYAVSDDGDDTVEEGELSLDASPPADVQSDRTYLQERQNFANWYSFYRRRELTATASIANVIASMQGVQIGLYSINGNLLEPVRKIKVGGVDETEVLLEKLYNLTIVFNAWTGVGYTPLRRGLRSVGRYFDQEDNLKLDGSSGNDSPYASADQGGGCQQAFAIVMTDGYWNMYSPDVGNADGDNNTDFDGPPYGDSYSDTLADVAMYYYEKDLSSGLDGLDNLVPTSDMDDASHQHMVTYAVSFGVFGTLDPDGYDEDLKHKETGLSIEWPDPDVGDTAKEKIDDVWHAAVNGRGTFLSAARPDELVSSLLSIMQHIESRIASASAVSVNGDELYEKLGEDILMFQAGYNSDGWTGDVKAYGINMVTGQVITTSYEWSAADELETVNWDTGRIIATYSGSGSAGIPFRFGSLTATQKSLLDANWEADDTAQKILDFLRGDTSNEESNDGSFRDRFWRLGDIVHSSPVYNNGVLYTGGNDGMLHAFDADNGTELFAYVPNLVFENLSQLADTEYTHQYYVDLTPTVKYVSSLDKTILVGGLGKGGRGYYALDVSSPSSITSETALAAKFLWEYGSDNDLGYTFSKPVIVNSNDSSVGWIVIFGNGYSSVNEHAVLYILNPSTGAVIKKIDTGVGSCNGLSTPVAIDVNNDEKVDYVYAGDLKGNLWKFDLTGSTSGSWDVSYKSGVTPKPVFQAKDPDGATQPITTKPDVMYHCDKDGYMVVFATGRYLGETDTSDPSIQTIYGVWDYGDDDDNSEYLGAFNRGSTPELSNQPDTVTLLQQTQVFYDVVDGKKLRVLSDNEAVWETEEDTDSTEEDPKWDNLSSTVDNHAGWYFDLPISGERVVSDLLIREGKAIIVSFYPETVACGSGGYSIVHEIDACTGGRLSNPQFDINEDQVINEEDLINIGTEENPEWVAPSGIEKSGRLQPPAILRMGNTEMKYFSSSSGTIATVREKAVRLGITYWIEVQQ